MSKFTPGPWVAKIEDDQVQGIYDLSGNRIVETDSGYYPPELGDANLIAAAPEMYEITKKVSELLSCGEGILRAEGKCNDLLCELLMLVPANILAKAEGAR